MSKHSDNSAGQHTDKNNAKAIRQYCHWAPSDIGLRGSTYNMTRLISRCFNLTEPAILIKVIDECPKKQREEKANMSICQISKPVQSH